MQNESVHGHHVMEDEIEFLGDEGMIIMEANLEKDVRTCLVTNLKENIIIGRGQVIGFRENQEDFENVLIQQHPFSSCVDEERTILCGVFDGHCGDECAKFIASKCLEEIAQDIFTSSNDVSSPSEACSRKQVLNVNAQVLEQTFAKLQSDYIKHRQDIIDNHGPSLSSPEVNDTSMTREEIISLGCGTTANIILLSSQQPSTIYSINCGDSRAIYFDGHTTHALSRDHKPTDLEESCRIKNHGGNIDEESGRIDGFLSYSRSLGDLDYQPIVSYSPELKIMERPVKKSKTEYIIIATDGLFEGFKTNEECTQCVNVFLEKHKLNSQNMCSVVNELVAYLLDTCVNDLQSMDNITLQIIMFFNDEHIPVE